MQYISAAYYPASIVFYPMESNLGYRPGVSREVLACLDDDQVNVYRDGTNSSSTWPTMFANIFGVGSQGVRATATAQVTTANASGCMRPWFIVDRTPNSYCVTGCNPPTYPISGYSDIGQTVTFHANLGPSYYGLPSVSA